MTTTSPTREPETIKTNEAHFWFCVVEATDSNGKLDYKLLAELAGYKNWNSAKAVFFGKRKQMRLLYGVKSEDGVKKRAGKKKKKLPAKGGEEKVGNRGREEEQD